MATNEGNASAATTVRPPNKVAYLNLSTYMYEAFDTPYSSTPLASKINFTPLLSNNNPVVSVDSIDPSISSAPGLYAEAFVSTNTSGPKQVIIAYEGTKLSGAIDQDLGLFSAAEIKDDIELFHGQEADSLPGSAAFANEVIALATSQGISEQNIYVTGHSLGGAEADYAASQTGLGGVTFAAPGINSAFTKPHPSNIVRNQDNVLNYIDAGDPIGNYAYDNGNTPLSSVLVSNAIRHYGKIDVLPNIPGEQNLEKYNGEYAKAKTTLGKAYVFAEALHANGGDHLIPRYAADLHISSKIYVPDGATDSTAGFSSIDTSYIAAALVSGGVSQSSSASSSTSSASVLAASSATSAMGVKAHAA